MKKTEKKNGNGKATGNGYEQWPPDQVAERKEILKMGKIRGIKCI